MTAAWDVVQNRLSAFQGVIRLRARHGWTLHSWNTFEVVEGGGRLATYREVYVASVWFKERTAGEVTEKENK